MSRSRQTRLTAVLVEVAALQAERPLSVSEIAPLAQVVARYNTRAHMRTARYRQHLALGRAAAAALGVVTPRA